jgi:non-specific serine/threonine protein kinase/serine/threonine-protein kinase
MPSIDQNALSLSAEQMARVDEILDPLLDLPEEDRLAALADQPIPDPAVAAEVLSLLKAANDSRDFLTSLPAPSAEPPAFDPAVGARLGPWRLTRAIGRGGMGDVYEAIRTEGDFEQRVAIKLLQREAGAQLERFQAERRILARLEHPGIARLYDGGVTDDQRPYMTMEFVEGRAITEYCRETAATFEQRLSLFMQVCEAVAFAHRNLIVHRDLKPSNILVTAGGTVKLLDFGIAKLLDAQRAGVTSAVAAPMTPICAAPEQLTGEPITTATDVYALGLLLFELLTGAHPWMGPDIPVLQAMRTVLQRPAPAASRVAENQAKPPVPVRLIRGDLDAIIAKALRQEPAHRYATVTALQSDVRRVLTNEPVEARDGARLYVFGRTIRRHRWAVAAVSVVILSLAGGLGVAAWQAERAAAERDSARRDAAREEAVRYSLTRLFRSALADQGNQSPTAKGMIDDSAQRVLREYRGEPQLAGELVLTLADLYGALQDINGAGTLLEGFLAQTNADRDPGAQADARQKLANIELLRGHIERAAVLLGEAQAFWARSPNRYREERLEGLTVEAHLERARGDLDAAIAVTRRAIDQRVALSGLNHRETAILYNSLAISLTAANRLDEALAAYHTTTDIYDALGLGEGLDAQIIVANTGTLELRVGHLRQAETLLHRAIERERALAGDSAAVAAAMGYYGKLLSITNRNSEAIAVLREAIDLGVRYAGAGSPLDVQNRIFLGEAEFSLGDLKAAAATLGATHDMALKQYGGANLSTLRAELALAQVEAAAGQAAGGQAAGGQAAVGQAAGGHAAAGQAAALAHLTDAVAGLRKLGSSGEANLARALTLLGELHLRLGQVTDAGADLREALALREKYPEDVWELAQVRERLGESLAAGHSAAAAPLLQQAARDLEAQLGADHPETLRAKAAMMAT